MLVEACLMAVAILAAMNGRSPVPQGPCLDKTRCPYP